MKSLPCLPLCLLAFALALPASAQLGQRFPSERKVVPDPVTGVPLTFLTSTPAGDSKIYPTHPQWTADGQWVVFRSRRVPGEAIAVNEKTGDMVQVTGTLQTAAAYETVYGIIPLAYDGAGELALDANEDQVYFRMLETAAAPLLPPGTEIAADFGPRGMGAGPTGVAKMDLATGRVSPVVAVPFQVGHIQSNPWVSGEIVFCWETGGKAPQRTWTVMADGTGLRPLFPENEYDWVTHEAITGPDEVAIAILGHRKVGVDDDWGKAASRLRPTGLGIVNLRTQEIYISGQTKSGSGLWHVHASADGRWAVGDDFARNLWLIDRRTNEMPADHRSQSHRPGPHSSHVQHGRHSHRNPIRHALRR